MLALYLLLTVSVFSVRAVELDDYSSTSSVNSTSELATNQSAISSVQYCTRDYECYQHFPNSLCVLNRCQCRFGYYNNSASCVWYFCNQNSQCRSLFESNTRCNLNHCTCAYGYSLNSNTQDCYLQSNGGILVAFVILLIFFMIFLCIGFAFRRYIVRRMRIGRTNLFPRSNNRPPPYQTMAPQPPYPSTIYSYNQQSQLPQPSTTSPVTPFGSMPSAPPQYSTLAPASNYPISTTTNNFTFPASTIRADESGQSQSGKL